MHLTIFSERASAQNQIDVPSNWTVDFGSAGYLRGDQEMNARVVRNGHTNCGDTAHQTASNEYFDHQHTYSFCKPMNYPSSTYFVFLSAPGQGGFYALPDEQAASLDPQLVLDLFVKKWTPFTERLLNRNRLEMIDSLISGTVGTTVNAAQNCHAYPFAYSDIWINDPDDVLAADYKLANGSAPDQQFLDGDIAVYVEHSTKITPSTGELCDRTDPTNCHEVNFIKSTDHKDGHGPTMQFEYRKPEDRTQIPRQYWLSMNPYHPGNWTKHGWGGFDAYPGPYE